MLWMLYVKDREVFSIFIQSDVYRNTTMGQNFQMLLPFMYHYLCPTMTEKLYGGLQSEREATPEGRLTEEEEKKKYQDYRKAYR